MCFILSLGVEWGLVFPDANGEYQSPINLNSREARYDPSLLDVRLSPNYVVCRDCEVTNDGHTIQVILKSKSGILEDARHTLVNSSHLGAVELSFSLHDLKGRTNIALLSGTLICYKVHFGELFLKG